MWLHITDESYASTYVNVDNITHITEYGFIVVNGRAGVFIRPWSEYSGAYMTGEEVMDMIRGCE